MSAFSKREHTKRFSALSALLDERQLSVDRVKQSLAEFAIEVPSWGFGDSGTRFGVFKQPGAARLLSEKVADAAMVHRLTGASPSLAIHIPWDMVEDFSALSAEAKSQGIRIGAVNPNVFQDAEYKLGSLANIDPEVRNKAMARHLQCCDIMRQTGSSILSLWYADGTNYPGQADMTQRKIWFEAAFSRIHQALPQKARMLIEYKPFEPAFYHTDIADWGMAYVFAKKAGPRAQVLVDLGHHLQGANVEHIVAFLLHEQILGGFHFNDRKYGDDDLTTGSINPYQVFLILNEVIAAKAKNIAYMVDQSHNLKPKIPAMLQTVLQIQRLYAKALVVDRQKLKEARAKNDLVGAENTLMEAFFTDVEPLLIEFRLEKGLHPEPMRAYEESGYQAKIEAERVGQVEGAAGWA